MSPAPSRTCARIAWGSALLGLCLASAGCAPTLPAKPQAAQIQAPAQWRAPAPGNTEAAAPSAEANWWQRANDPALNALVDAALKHNLDLHMAAERVREARAHQAQARSLLWPSLDAGLAISRGQTVNAFGQPSLANSGQPVLQASYEVDLFGRVDAQISAAQQGALAAEHAQAAARLTVAASTAGSYFQLCALEAQRQILLEAVANREQALRLAQSRLEAGYTSELEPSQARAELEGVRQQLPRVEQSIARLEHALSLLSGQLPGSIAHPSALDALTLPAVAPEQPSELLRRRPDLAQAEAQLAAADAQLALARAQFLPQLRLTASAGRYFSTALPGAPIDVWSLGGSLLAPLFNGGRLDAAFDAAGARRDQAALQYKKTVLQAFKEVEDALVALRSSERLQTALQTQEQAVTRTLFHAHRRYSAGYSSYLEEIDAQRSLLNVRMGQVQARADALQARVALHQALGGGWQQPQAQQAAHQAADAMPKAH